MGEPQSDQRSKPVEGTAENLLQVEDLRVSFPGPLGPVEIVCGLSFDLPKATITGLVGESGCGKSVTALALIRLLEGAQLSGRVLLEGEDLLALPEKRMRRVRGKEISMVFQEPLTALNPVLSIGTQVAEVFRIHQGMNRKQAREASEEILAKVGLSDPKRRLKQYPHELSGGMRQRVLMAMALACRPKLLIADEPTTALDVTVQAQILDLLLSLQEELDLTLLFITHDLAVVAQTCDRIMVLYSGRLVESGPTRAVLDQPGHPYTKGLLDSLPERAEPRQPLVELAGRLPDPAHRPKGCAFRPRCNRADDQCHQVPELKNIASDRALACHHPLLPS